jgi:hypothetical protein
MKQRSLSLVLLVGAVALVGAACGDGGSGDGATTTLGGSGVAPVATAVPRSLPIAPAGVPFTLEPGDVVGLGSEATTVRLGEVIEDSRCPEDETCVWEGAVAVAVDWEAAATAGSVVLRGIASPSGAYFGDAPFAALPGGDIIGLLGLDGENGVPVVTVVWNEATT